MTAQAPRRPPYHPDATTSGATVRPAQPRCPGCGAAIDEQHDRVCDVARCRATGLQWMACDVTDAATGTHQPDAWTGRWPGEEDCERLGFLARFVPGRGWAACAVDDPAAEPDFDRLHAEAIWDMRRGRWVA